MDSPNVWEIVSTVGTAIAGWFVKGNRDEINRQEDARLRLSDELADHKVKVAESYVTHAALDVALDDIKSSLRRIETKLMSGND